jgi:hypothetical protein
MVRKGPIVFSVGANRSMTEPDLEMAIEAAKKIIARIE